MASRNPSAARSRRRLSFDLRSEIQFQSVFLDSLLSLLPVIMSDTEMDEAPRGSDEVDLNKSLQDVLKSAASNDGLARGLRGQFFRLLPKEFIFSSVLAR